MSRLASADAAGQSYHAAAMIDMAAYSFEREQKKASKCKFLMRGRVLGTDAREYSVESSPLQA